MANEMPDPARYTGLSRKVLEYSAAFVGVMAQLKAGGKADWGLFETIVNPATFQREGVFLGPQAEAFGWETYKDYITRFGAMADWEGTLRHITEQGSRVILELEERNTFNGETDVSHTVTIYEFDPGGRVEHLDVYVMPLRKQPAGAIARTA